MKLSFRGRLRQEPATEEESATMDWLEKEFLRLEREVKQRDCKHGLDEGWSTHWPGNRSYCMGCGKELLR